MLTHRDTILGQEYREFEGSSVAKDGRHVPILVHGNTLRDDRGNVIGNMVFGKLSTGTAKCSARLAFAILFEKMPRRRPAIF